MAARPWTQADDAELRRLHGEGKSLHHIAGEMGRGKGTISRKAKDLGLPWDRTDTAAATSAKVADAKSRRAQLQLGLLEDAERLRVQLWQPTVAFNFGGKDNTYNETRLDEPTFADKLKIMQAAGAAIDRALKLDLHDAGAGTAQVIGLLQRTAAALGLNDAADTKAPE